MANNDKWVDDRLNALAPPAAWAPDSSRALGKVRQRDQIYRKRRAQWMGTAMAAGILAAAVLLTPAKCAFGVCRTPEMSAVADAPPAPAAVPAAVPAQAPARTAAPAPVVAAKPQKGAPLSHPGPAVSRNFKESGDPNAPITCEVYTDYQCPHCATIYEQIIPMLRAEYVQTGKMEFVHRDMPLPMHAHAKLAARYANAAGQLGQYEVVVHQIFRTQATWAQNGDIDTEVAQVLAPDLMEKVRDLVRNDERLDDTVLGDVTMARHDGINQTPSMVITYKGKRQVLAPVPPYGLLKSYLDELLTK